LNDFFAGVPGLGEDRDTFVDDVEAVRGALPEVDDPWA
jgi:hypothetical protein